MVTWERDGVRWVLKLGRLGELVVTGGNGGGYEAAFKSDLSERQGPFNSVGAAQEAALRLAEAVILEAGETLKH